MQLVGLRHNVGPPHNTPGVEPYPEDRHHECQWVKVFFVRSHRVGNGAVLEECEREEDDVKNALEDVVGEAKARLLSVNGAHDQLVHLTLGDVSGPHVFDVLAILFKFFIIGHLVVCEQV